MLCLTCWQKPEIIHNSGDISNNDWFIIFDESNSQICRTFDIASLSITQ